MSINRADDFVRYISKNGDLALVAQSSIDWARRLNNDEKVALYIRVRDESQRLEDEWRGEFAAKVEIADRLLPATDTTDER